MRMPTRDYETRFGSSQHQHSTTHKDEQGINDTGFDSCFFSVMTSTRRSSKVPERGYSNVPFATRESVSRLQSNEALHAYRQGIVAKNPSRTWKTEAPTFLKDVLGTRLSDLKDFKVPVFEKTAEELTLIQKALQQNFIFADLNSTDLNSLILSFEPLKAPKDTLLIEQGETGDYFYVIGEGQVTFEVNNATVGSAGAGTSFGELALLYHCPRAATVVASSALTKPTKLFRVDQTTFRAILQKQTEQLEAQRSSLLRSVHYLDDVLSGDLKRLGRVMIPRVFEEGDRLITKGALCDTFFVLQEGEVTSSENSTPGSSLKVGDCFGGEALVAIKPSDVNVTATTKGMAWSIDQATFQKVFGNLSRLLMRFKARRTLGAIKMFTEANIQEKLLDELIAQVTEERYQVDTTIFQTKQYTEAAWYFVHEGSVQLSGGRNEVIKAGEYFGDEQLLLDARRSRTPSPTSPSAILTEYTAMATEDCVCGVLTLSDCRTVFDTTTLVDTKALQQMFEPNQTDDDDFAAPPTASLDRMTTQEWLMQSSQESLRDMVREDLALDDLKKISRLGEGQYGDVWLVSAQIGYVGNQHFALKMQHKNDRTRGSSEEVIMEEIEVLQQMDHPQIVNIIHYYEDPEKIYILMGLVHGGELFDVIHQQGDDGLWYSGMPEDHAKFYTIIITDTLNYIHRKQYAFRDLKPENVLIDVDGYPIICDFGFAKLLPDDCKTYTMCGTPNYLAPEVIMNRGHSRSVDHWSLGVMVYEMIAGENPFYHDGMDQIALFKAIVEDKYYALPNEVSDEAYLVVDHLLEKDPLQRLGSLAGGGKDIIRSRWLENLDLVKLRQKRLKAPFIPNNLQLASLMEEASGEDSLLDD